MKLLRKLNEDAAGGAVGASCVAGAAMPLFSSLVSRTKPPKKRKVNRLKKVTESEHAHDSGNFDAAHVISKLKSLETRDQTAAKDTVSFGLEDDNNQIVRVAVRSEQADSFEEALQSLLVNQDEQEPLDLAEILFNLKDQFDIVDVIWPDIVEDEEQDMELNQQGTEGDPMGGDPGMEGDPMGGDMGLEGDPGMEGDPMGGDMGLDAGAGAGGMEDEKTLLTQIIDMMKADAEARKAEAIAKSAEAKAREAAAAHAQILTKVKQEEQFLDMEAHNKQRKEAEREAKRLAQLARYKHEVSNETGQYMGDDSDDLDTDAVVDAIGSKHRGSDEDEETHLRRPAPTKAQPNKRVLPADIARYVMSRAR